MKINCLIFLLIFCSCSNSRHKIVIVRTPNDLSTNFAIRNEQLFKSLVTTWGDTVVRFKRHFNLVLNENINLPEQINIRTKVVHYFPNGVVDSFYMDKHGRILMNGKIYEGSLRQMKRLRGKEPKIKMPKEGDVIK